MAAYTASTSTTNLSAPSPFNRARRATSPAHFEHAERKPPPPVEPLGLPNPSFLQDLTGSLGGLSPTSTRSGSGDEMDNSITDAWGERSRGHRSNSTSAGGLVELAARVGSVVTSAIATQPRSPLSRPASSHPSDAEIEAEATREREHSRREAERILLMEAEERRRAEERALSRQSGTTPQTPPRPRRGTIDVPSPSPRPSGEVSPSGRWWSIAKQKLTPNKDKDEPLTPAQEIIREAKLREKEARTQEMEREKERLRSSRNAWPASPKAKQNDPSYIAMQTTSPTAVAAQQTPPRPSHLTTSPLPARNAASPVTPPRFPSSVQTTNLNLSPSPAPRASGPSRAPSDATSMYAQFNPNTGALDVPATLLTVATRFEKLERWTVSHVRALEDRMKDVERYLVDRENREDELKKDVSSIRTSLKEFENIFNEVKPAAPSAELSTVPSTSRPPVEPLSYLSLPQSRDVAASDTPGSPVSMTASLTSSAFHSASASPPRATNFTASTSPPASKEADVPLSPSSITGSETTGPTGTVKSINFRSRLPYPSGDYYDLTSTSQLSDLSHNPPTPPLARPFAERTQQGSPVLPLPRAVSPLALSPLDIETQSIDTSSNRGTSNPSSPLSVPSQAPLRARSKTPSPTPRKRYTVALSGREDSYDSHTEVNTDAEEHLPLVGPRKVHTALITDSPTLISQSLSIQSLSSTTSSLDQISPLHSPAPPSPSTARTDPSPSPSGEVKGDAETTIGRTSISLSRLSLSPPPSDPRGSPSLIPSPIGTPTPQTRVRAQSNYSTSPLKLESPGSNESSPNTTSRKRSQSSAQPTGRGQFAVFGMGLSANASSRSLAVGGSKTQGDSREPDVFIKPRFVDPLIIRKKEKERRTQEVVKPLPPGKKLPVEQLVAFFDSESR